MKKKLILIIILIIMIILTIGLYVHDKKTVQSPEIDAVVNPL